MILTDKDIRALCTNEKKSTAGMINPFFEESLQSESYDLAIGKRIAVLKKEVRCIDITDQNKIDSIYDEMELPASGYVLSPKEYVLVSLREILRFQRVLQLIFVQERDLPDWVC